MIFINILTRMNVLFLDVDGVLNNYSILTYANEFFDNRFVSRLRTIIKRTRCVIVLSTGWRLHTAYKDLLLLKLEEFGIDDKLIVGETPNHTFKKRKKEITEWLNSNQKKVKKWVVLDDMELQFPDKHYVKTSLYNGLTYDKMNEVIKKFNLQ
jgi:histidinol phosphatase-like enzyme